MKSITKIAAASKVRTSSKGQVLTTTIFSNHNLSKRENGNSLINNTWIISSTTQNGKNAIRNYSVHTSPKGNTKVNNTTKQQENNENGDTTLLRQELVPVTLNCIKYKYENGIPLTMLTATDYHSASVVDQTNCDMILVGDSLSMTALGQPNTTSVTMDEMIHHAKAVKRGSQYSFLIGDMPFGSYVTDESAVHNAVRFIKEAEMNSVKLEGGERVASKIKSIVDAGIVVVAHIGLTPQSCNQLGGFRVVGSKNSQEAIQLWKDALAVKEAGASLIVLECVPQRLANLITKHIGVPTIGIGSGQCSGQVLVYHDILGMYSKFTPKFCKQYLNLNPVLISACENYVKDVVGGEFPQKSHTFIIKDEVYNVVSEFIEKDVKSRPLNEIVTPIPPLKKKNAENSPPPPSIVDYNNLSERPRVLILGSGSVGCLMAVSLSDGGECDVRMLSGRRNSNHDNDSSLEISRQVRQLGEGNESIQKETQSIIKKLSESELSNEWLGEIDVLIVAVKSYATSKAIRNMIERLPSLSKIKHVITVQNGYGNDETILNSLSSNNNFEGGISINPLNIYSGVRTLSNETNRKVLEQSNSEKISISLPKPLVNTQLGNLFTKNSNFELSSIINSTIVNGKSKFIDWTKLLINSCINPLASLHQIENGKLLTNIPLQNMMKMLIKEQLNIMRMIPGAIDSLATSQELKEKSLEQIMFEKVMRVCELTQSNHCSMLVDLSENGNNNNHETEIMYLNGAFVELASQLKIDAPCNKMIVQLIQAKNNVNQ